MYNFRYICLSLCLLFAFRVAAEEAEHFTCDEEFIRCKVADMSLTVGDNVGFFDENDSLCAVGSVVTMQVDHRQVVITELFTKIPADAIVKVLAPQDNSGAGYRIRVDTPSTLFGTEVALMIPHLTDQLLGYDYSVYFNRRLYRDLSLIFRAGYSFMHGEIRKRTWEGMLPFTVHVHAINLLSGISYTAFSQSLFSLGFELGLGVSAVNNLTEEDISLNEDFSGLFFHTRTALSLLLNLHPWRVGISPILYSYGHGIVAQGVGVSLSKSI